MRRQNRKCRQAGGDISEQDVSCKREQNKRRKQPKDQVAQPRLIKQCWPQLLTHFTAKQKTDKKGRPGKHCNKAERPDRADRMRPALAIEITLPAGYQKSLEVLANNEIAKKAR